MSPARRRRALLQNPHPSRSLVDTVAHESCSASCRSFKSGTIAADQPSSDDASRPACGNGVAVAIRDGGGCCRRAAGNAQRACRQAPCSRAAYWRPLYLAPLLPPAFQQVGYPFRSVRPETRRGTKVKASRLSSELRRGPEPPPSLTSAVYLSRQSRGEGRAELWRGPRISRLPGAAVHTGQETLHEPGE